MTLQESSLLHMCGIGSVHRTPTPFVVVQVASPLQDVRPRTELPSGSPNFNGLSVNDVKFISQFRQSDPLHLPSIVDSLSQRGKALSSYAKSVGAKAFVQNYFKR